MEGEENKLTTFLTWTDYNVRVQTSFSSSISANLGNSEKQNSQVFGATLYGLRKAATLSYFLRASGGGGEQTNYIFHMDYNVCVCVLCVYFTQ